MKGKKVFGTVFAEKRASVLHTADGVAAHDEARLRKDSYNVNFS